jgi:phosphoglucomutase
MVAASTGWFAARPSGTESLYKIYAESFRDADHLREIQRDAQAIVGSLFSDQDAAAAPDNAVAGFSPQE